MIYVITFFAFALVIAGMAIGVIAGRAPISGSCGGVGRLGIDQKCEICGGDPQVCETETRTVADSKAQKDDSGVVTYDPRA